MKEVNKMPKAGQFVAMWEFNNLLWSMICRWDGEDLTEYDQVNDVFNVRGSDVRPMDDNGNFIEVRFFVV